MTEIQFHFNVPARVPYACRVLRKAWRQGVGVALVADETELAAIDDALWRLGPADFIPHERIARAADAARVPASLQARTVWLCRDADSAPAQHTLVNLGAAPPRGFEAYQRLFELVSTDEAAREAARARWRGYGKRGYAIRQHDLAQGAAG